jgi:hypothetical protein
MRLALIISMLAGMSACSSDPWATPETGEMVVAKQALRGCLYDIVPKGQWLVRPAGQWVIHQDDVSSEGVPIVRAYNGADRQREAALNTCVQDRTLASPEFHKVRARAL